MSGETVIHPEGVPCRFAFLSERNLGGGELLVQHTDSNLPPIRLSLSARRIWDLCDGRNSISGIAQELAKVVSVRTKDLLGDVRAAISRLELAHVLIVRRDGRRHDLWHRTIDWSRVAEPQLDEYDTNITLRLSAIPSESKYTTIDKRAETRCERIRVCRIYPKKNGLQDAPLDHGNINTAISYLRLWPTLYLQFIRIISVFHPRLDPTQPMGVDAQGRRIADTSRLFHLFSQP